MKTTVSFYDFRDAFRAYDRGDQFSYEGLKALFDHLEQMERDNGVETELDVVALCCDYYEDTPEAIAANYSIDIEGMDEDEIVDAVREYVEANGALIGETDSGFVYACF